MKMFFSNNYSLFKKENLKVGVIKLVKDTARVRDAVNLIGIGLKLLREESKYEWVQCSPSEIDNYDVCLLPLTSCDDVYTAVLQLPTVRKARVIAGGPGCIAIRSLIGLIDVAVFGRAEGQIDAIIDDTCDENNIWRASVDPFLEGRYEIRQAAALLPGEMSIGCVRKCTFCQYTQTRLLLGSGYHPGTFGNTLNESDHYANMETDTSRRKTTAWDGFSQQTRSLIKKGLSDDVIMQKLSTIITNKFDKTVKIKIFVIVGYPWEDENTISNDLVFWDNKLKELDNITGGRIFAVMQITPLNPMPLTQLELEPITEIDWHAFFKKYPELAEGKNYCFYFDRRIPGPYATFRYAMINRGAPYDLIRGIVPPKNGQEAIALIRNYSIYTGRQENKPVGYLSPIKARVIKEQNEL